MAYTKPGSPFLFDETTNDIVGFKDRDTSEVLLSSVSGALKAAGVVVVIGSSGGAGMGSSGYTTDPGLGGAVSATSWSGLWAAELQAQGYTVYNVSISGTSTAQSIARFAADVASKSPTHVVLCNNPQNDGFTANPVTGSRTYVENCLKLARMSVNIGAVPILGNGIYPNASWGMTHLAAARQMLDQFEQAGYTTVNAIEPLLNATTGALLAGFASDGLHFQDPGQAAIFSAIPPTLVQNSIVGVQRKVATHNRRAKLGAETTIGNPMSLTMARSAESWTFAARFHGDAGIAGSKAFLLFREAAFTSVLRIRNSSGVYELAEGATLVSSAINPTTDTGAHVIAITKHKHRAELKMFVDGVQVGSTNTTASAIALSQMGFDLLGRGDIPGTNAQNSSVSSVYFWRVAFPDDVVAQISAGYLPLAGAEVLADDFRWTPVAHMPNGARSLELLRVNSSLFTLV